MPSPSATKLPIITSIAVSASIATETYAYDVEAKAATTTSTLNYSLAVAPEGMTIDASTGLIIWVPSAANIGDHAVTVKVTDSSATDSLTNQSYVLTVKNSESSLLVGQQKASPAKVNLTVEGTLDWVHWGRTSATGIDRKRNVSPQISNFTPIDNASPPQGKSGATAFSWTDGTPDTSVSDSKTDLRVFVPGKGFEITVPADTALKTLALYLGAYQADGTLEVSISDSSSENYVAVISSSSVAISNMIAIDFKAAADDQTLKIRYALHTTLNPNDRKGWVSLESATLFNRAKYLSLPYTQDFSVENTSDWAVVNSSGEESNWQVVNGAYQQENSVGFTAVAMDGAYHVGTYSMLTTGANLTDYQFNVKASPLAVSGQDIGVMVHLNNINDSYLRLSLNAANGFSRLESKAAGTFSTLAKNARGYEGDTQLNISMNVQGPIVIATVNGDKIFGGYDSAITQGTVGLYCRDKCAFDDVEILSNDTKSVIAITKPVAYTVLSDLTFNVGAVVINPPADAIVEFNLNGATSACKKASDTDHENYFIATCTAPAIGNYQLQVYLKNSGGEIVDTDINAKIGIGENIIAIGDSITVGLDDNTANDAKSENHRMISSLGYEAKLNDYLEDELQSTISIIHKAATPGDTSTLVETSRLTGIVERHPDATRAIVTIGVNDAGGSNFTPSGLDCSRTECDGTFKGNLQAIIDKLITAGKSVIVNGVPPRFGDSFQAPYSDPANHARNLLIRDGYNAVIANQLTKIQQIGPDFYDYFLGSENRFYLYATNLHPNALGYEVMAQLIRNSITGNSELPFVVNNLCVKKTVSDSCQSPLTYKQNLLESGDKYYVDENFALTGDIPSVLNNGRWIMTANQDRDLTNANYLSFTIPQLSTVYIAFDAGASTLPAWMNTDFTDTGLALNTNNPATPSMKLYSKSGMNGNVAFGAADAVTTNAEANYIVIIVKQ